MKKDKIVKMVMSAAVMVSMAAVPASAEGAGEDGGPDAGGLTDIGEEAVSPEAAGAAQKILEDVGETFEKVIREQAQAEGYWAERSISEGPGAARWQNRETGETGEYGPHCVELAGELIEEEAPQAEEPQEAALSYTEEDLYILAHAICGEGQCYPDEEQLYIGSVILNRRSHGAYPDSIKGVVFQKGQYACTWDGNYYREPTEANWRNAKWLLENGSILPGNVVYQAGFRQGNGVYLQTRYHKYCYRS